MIKTKADDYALKCLLIKHINSILTINNDSCYLVQLIFDFVNSVKFNNRTIYQFNKLIRSWLYSFVLYKREAQFSARPLWTEISSSVQEQFVQKETNKHFTWVRQRGEYIMLKAERVTWKCGKTPTS